jgi:two-component system response regulator
LLFFTAEDPMTTETLEPPIDENLGTQMFRVLLAEDDGAFRTLLREWLESMGAVVTEALDGLMLIEQLEGYARAAITDRPFDLVVTDHRMPGAAGGAAVQVSRRQGVDVPTLVISAFPEDELVATLKEDGVEVLTKPFTLDRFREKITEVRGQWQVSASAG